MFLSINEPCRFSSKWLAPEPSKTHRLRDRLQAGATTSLRRPFDPITGLIGIVRDDHRFAGHFCEAKKIHHEKMLPPVNR